MTAIDLKQSSDSNQTIGADLAASLRGEICRGRFQAGDRLLPEREIAARYKVNRTSVREALKILQKEGFIAIGRSGATVQPRERVSLGALHHLLFVDGEPNEDLIEQLFFVHRTLLYGAIEQSVESSTEEQQTKIKQLLMEWVNIFEPGAFPFPKQSRYMHLVLYELFGMIIVSSNNLPLRMIYQAMDPVILSDLGNYYRAESITLKSPLGADIKKIIHLIDKREGAGIVPIVRKMFEVNFSVIKSWHKGKQKEK